MKAGLGISRRLLVPLYLIAGTPLGIFADLVPVYLRSQGMGLGDIGIFSVLHLFYSLKVVWGPQVDRSGHPRRWLWGTGLVLGCAYACLSQIQPRGNVPLFALACMLMVWASSVYDVAVDASFVRNLTDASPAQEANANAWRLSSFKFAMVAVSNGCAVLGAAFGFQRVFLGLLVCHAAGLASVPWRALPHVPGRAIAWGDYFRGLRDWLRGPKVAQAFALVFCYKLAIASLLSLERIWWLDRGINLAKLGLVGAPVGLVTTVAGASLGSLLAFRAGVVAMLRWGVLAQAATALLYLVLLRFSPCWWTLCLGLSASGCCFGLSTAALMSLITRLCRAPHAATQFAALTGTYALTRSLAGTLSGHVAERFGYPAFFVLVAALSLPALVLLPRRAEVRRAWRLEA